MAGIPRLQPQSGTALLSYGFRPFFLFGSAYAALSILIWLPLYEGELSFLTAFAPRDWHVHEMLYGFVPAVVTGFILTAIPNWTGRFPLQGMPLLGLLLLWGAGRVAVAASAQLGWLVALVIDSSFLFAVAGAAAREIAAGKNWRNLPIVLLIALLAAGNVGFHLEAHFAGVADYAIRAGLAVMVLLISLVGGRIIPSFTHNWLARQAPGRMPAPFARFDVGVIALSLAALVIWVALPLNPWTGGMLLVSGAVHLVRLARWAGERTLREPLLAILHLGYAFVPLGFILLGLAAVTDGTPTAGIHAWAGGAIGTMTLAVMSRASLGHTGRDLHASRFTQAVYLAVLVAALCRIAAALTPANSIPLLCAAALLWALAFGGFAVIYAPVLLKPPVRRAA